MDSQQDKIEQSKNVVENKPALQSDFERLIFKSKDNNLFFIYQKIKKLVAVLYMVTDSFEKEEPLRRSLRERGGELLRFASDIHAFHAFVKTKEEEGKALILETVSLLEVASFSGLVSSMNIAVIKREFEDLIRKIALLSGEENSSSVVLKSDFFVPTAAEKELYKEMEKDKESRINSFVAKNTSNVLYKSETEIKKEMPPVPSLTQPSEDREDKKEILKEFGSVAVKRNHRQSAIINLLKKKKEIMIKDLAGIITGCSEKTIQRELASLVDAGILKKWGERRWTKYSLVLP